MGFGYNSKVIDTLKSWAPRLRGLDSRIAKLEEPGEVKEWLPFYDGGGAMTFTGVTTEQAICSEDKNGLVHFYLRAYGTTGGTATFGITASLLIPPDVSKGVIPVGGYIRDAGAGNTMQPATVYISTTKYLIFNRTDLANWSLGANRYIHAFGCYKKEVL